MGKYRIGKDIGKLLARVKALEARLAHPVCPCAGGAEGAEFSVRAPTDEELAAETRKKTHCCVYFVAGFVGAPCPGIAIGDFVCVSPCPPCHEAARLRIVNAAGATLCLLVVRPANHERCTTCPPGGHRFVWAN